MLHTDGGLDLSRTIAICALVLAGTSAFAQDCGPDVPCEIDGGSYHLRLPTGDGHIDLLADDQHNVGPH